MSRSIDLHRLTSWDNLTLAWQKAAHGKRGGRTAAGFEFQLADRLLSLQHSLRDFSYQPGGYSHFYIHEPKRRRISAAPFRDRVVHHALCNLIEPEFERRFVADSYANRKGKGTHRAVDRLQRLAQCREYALSMDIVKHFPSIDHAVLKRGLFRVIKDADIREYARRIIASGDGVLDNEYEMAWFPGDDLLANCRPRGLPIGNLTSQFWSNCYLHDLDMFVQRTLGCAAYVRYVDDFVLLSDSKRELWDWKRAVVERLARLRLTAHESRAHVVPVTQGVPWLGFLVFPTHRRVKGRKVRHARGRLGDRFEDWAAGRISFGEFDASVQGWVNHVRYADSWRLREAVLSEFTWGPDGPAKKSRAAPPSAAHSGR